MSSAAGGAPPPDVMMIELSTAIEPLLLKPLWKIASGYFDLAEQWYYAGVKVFQLDPDAVLPIGDARVGGPALDAVFKDVVEQDHFHILNALHQHVRRHWNNTWNFIDSIIVDIIRLDRVRMLEFVYNQSKIGIVFYYEEGISDGLSWSARKFIQVHHPDQLLSYDSGDVNQKDFSTLCGSLDVLKWEQKHGLKKWTKRTSKLLARCGHVSVLQALLAEGCPWDVETYYAAVKNNNVDLVRWLESHGDDHILSGVETPTYKISVEMMKYFLTESRFPCYPEDMMAGAAVEGTLEMVQYLVEQTSAMDDLKRSDVVKWACTDINGDPAKLKYLLDRGFPMPDRNGYLVSAIYEWFSSRGYKYRR